MAGEQVWWTCESSERREAGRLWPPPHGGTKNPVIWPKMTTTKIALSL
jgi:hypothetical protein